MRRVMLASRWRDANGFYFGHGWRALTICAAVYLIARML
jgi:hypothetical protein